MFLEVWTEGVKIEMIKYGYFPYLQIPVLGYQYDAGRLYSRIHSLYVGTEHYVVFPGGRW